MPAHPVFDDLKAVQFNLDGESRRQLLDLVRAEKSSNSAVVRRLISHAHVALLRARFHLNEELTANTPTDQVA